MLGLKKFDHTFNFVKSILKKMERRKRFKDAVIELTLFLVHRIQAFC